MLCRIALVAMSLAPMVMAACGDTTADPSSGRLVTPASGLVTLTDLEASGPISGFVFENRGTGDITISHLLVVLADGQEIDTDQTVGDGFGFGVRAGQAATYAFDSDDLHTVDSLSFEVQGMTEALAVSTTQAIGRVPAHR